MHRLPCMHIRSRGNTGTHRLQCMFIMKRHVGKNKIGPSKSVQQLVRPRLHVDHLHESFGDPLIMLCSNSHFIPGTQNGGTNIGNAVPEAPRGVKGRSWSAWATWVKHTHTHTHAYSYGFPLCMDHGHYILCMAWGPVVINRPYLYAVAKWRWCCTSMLTDHSFHSRYSEWRHE